MSEKQTCWWCGMPFSGQGFLMKPICYLCAKELGALTTNEDVQKTEEPIPQPQCRADALNLPLENP